MPKFDNQPLKTLPIDIIGGTTFSRYDQMSVEQTINMTVTGADSDSAALIPFSGYKPVLNFNRGQARGIFISTRLNEMIVVFGSSVYVVSSYLGYRLVGNLDSTNGPVHIAENFNKQIAIEDGAKIYIYNYGIATFTKPFIEFVPIYIDYQDGYFIATASDGTWHLSDNNNGNLWPALDYRNLQTKADILQAAVVLDRQLWIMGQKVSEVWCDQGQQIFPYVRENSFSVPYGVFSRETIAVGFGMVVWLAKNEQSQPAIMFMNGAQPQKISNDGLDFVISQMKSPSDSEGFLFQQDGHIFYQITFNSDNFSIIYDFNTKLFFNVTDHNLDKHIAKQVVLFNDVLYFISNIDSKLYEMSTEIYTYDGLEIPRIRVTKHYRNPTNETFIVNRLGVQLEEGENVGDSSVDLSFSLNGGRSFGNVVRHHLRRQGVRQGQMTFFRLGQGNVFTFQFRFWGFGRFVVSNATMDIYS